MTIYVDELRIGDSVTTGKTVTEADLLAFCGISLDVNPIHYDAEFAKTTRFGDIIVPGLLVSTHVSAILGNHLPGPGTVYLGQNLKFKAPVRLRDTVKTTVTVREIIPEKNRVILDTVCKVGDTVVIEGEATVMIGKRPT